MNSDVWINGVHLGRRPFGYIRFGYDITPHLCRGVNVVAVRVDNSLQPNSRWYSGSGIYRHVWLTIADPLHVAHWGTFITTPRADSAGADVLVRTKIENAHISTRSGVVRVGGRRQQRARGGTGRIRHSRSPPARPIELAQRMPVASPQLWSRGGDRRCTPCALEGPRRGHAAPTW